MKMEMDNNSGFTILGVVAAIALCFMIDRCTVREKFKVVAKYDYFEKMNVMPQDELCRTASGSAGDTAICLEWLKTKQGKSN